MNTRFSGLRIALLTSSALISSAHADPGDGGLGGYRGQLMWSALHL
ncbi:hypothetical protein [Roseibium sp. SCP14]